MNAISLSSKHLSIDAVLRCGQSFRWSAHPLPFYASTEASSPNPSHEYRLCLRDRVVCLQQTTDTLFYRSVFPDPQPSSVELLVFESETLAWLHDYFQLSVDLENLYDQWAGRDNVFSKVRDRFPGIRMLRQDPWENLISFICSSNNNISRISKMVQSLCKIYSRPLLSIPDPGNPANIVAYYPFPPPSALAPHSTREVLRASGFGYRADYIQRTAEMLVDAHGTDLVGSSLVQAAEQWLHGLRRISTSEAREELMKFVGVGRKVADCVLLMSLDKHEVVPVDTHVHQIAIKHYGFKASTKGKAPISAKLYEMVNSMFQAVWGEYAGWAHSILFTADLKAFSMYNLLPSSPSSPAPKHDLQMQAVIPTPPLAHAFSDLKRKLDAHTTESVENDILKLSLATDVNTSYETSAERVKKRHRRAC